MNLRCNSIIFNFSINNKNFRSMKKFYFLAALVAGTALTSCTSEDDLALSPPNEVIVEDGYAPIVFSSLKSNITRADFEGAAAAKLLGNQFVVYGYKGSKTLWQTADDDTQTPAIKKSSTVFDNYLVKYIENSADKSESNSTNWEYVLDNSATVPIPHAKENGITKQTIKYWDYSQTQYDFIAWSTGSKTAIYSEPDDGIPSGSVLVTAIKPQAATGQGATGLGTAYTFKGEAEDLRECYIADLVTVYKGNVPGNDPAPYYNVVANGYQQPVKLRFRQLGTKVRIAIYETVPGYSVKKVQFYSAANVDTLIAGTAKPETSPAENYTVEEAMEINASAKIFTTEQNGIYKEGTYTVTFPTVDQPANADNNQAHIEFAPLSGADQKTTVDWGGLNYTFRESGESSKKAIYLGRSSNTASFAGDPEYNYYVVYLPNQKGTNLNLRVNFTLESIDGSKEEIVVKGATAQVPSIYTAWKPGYAYTYLFKISDKTNGYTGVYDPTKPDDTTVNSDPAGLYPITFDAIVVNAEDDATQETITTISTPSITTYQNGSNVVNNNEYTVLMPNAEKKTDGHIYVTVNDANAAEYEAVDANTLTVGTSSVANYYTKVGNDYYPCAPDAKAATGITYYKKTKEPALPNGNLANLDGKAALYTIPEYKTEAEVIDALSLQDENATGATAGTITGRSGLVLTPATKVDAATDINAAGEYALTNEVQYGADGNTITVETDQALRFKPAANTTYAFVYTKQAANPATGTPIYQPVTKAVGAAVGDNVYRYALIAGTAGDVQKDVTYFAKNDGSEDAITAFLGQNVSNLYLDEHGTQQATGYAKTGTSYYYTPDNGLNYYLAHNMTLAEYASANLYSDSECTQLVTNKGDRPADGTAYYWIDSNDNNKKYYCVFTPQRAEDLYVIDTDEAHIVKCIYSNDENDANDEKAVKGMIYLDKYTQNNGVYYVKVIKIAAAN